MTTQSELAVNIIDYCCLESLKKLKKFDYIYYGNRNLLFFAVKRSTPDFVEFLLSKNVSLNLVDILGETPLSEACRHDNLPIVKYILNLDELIYLDLTQALKWACINENYSMALLLLEKGANPNRPYCMGDTVLNLCVTRNKMNLVRLLLQYNADPNAKLTGDFTPFTTAIYRNNIPCVILLRIYGADQNLKWTNVDFLTRLTLNWNYSELHSFLNASFKWSDLEVALASRNIKDTKFLIANKRINLKQYNRTNLLNFVKKDNMYANQPKYFVPLYYLIQGYYNGWKIKNHPYYPKKFRQCVKYILASKYKMKTIVPEELWFFIFSFVLL